MQYKIKEYQLNKIEELNARLEWERNGLYRAYERMHKIANEMELLIDEISEDGCQNASKTQQNEPND